MSSVGGTKRVCITRKKKFCCARVVSRFLQCINKAERKTTLLFFIECVGRGLRGNNDGPSESVAMAQSCSESAAQALV